MRMFTRGKGRDVERDKEKDRVKRYNRDIKEKKEREKE